MNKKTIISCFAVLTLSTSFAGTAFSQQKAKSEDEEQDRWGHSPGTWDAVVKDGIVNIQFYGRHWSNGRNFTMAELGTLPAGKIGEFTLSRESGKMTFKGVFQDHWGHGSYTFEQNASFKSYLEQKGYSGLDDELMLAVFFTDINKAYFDFMKDNGYPSISNDQFKDLAEQNMSRKVLEDYFTMFKAEGYGHQPIDKLVELREHGVTAKYIASIHQMGYKGFSLDKALELRDHGVTADYIASLKKMGDPNVTLDQAQDLRDHGVTTEYVASLKKLGYPNMTLDKAQELRDHGVTVEYVNSMQKLGYKDITLDKAQDLRDHGVTAGFIKSINDLGFKNISLEKAEDLRNHGVTASYIKKMKSKGIKLDTLDDFIKLRDTGFDD
ncbi:hypothetical protein [Mucilaginibacter ginsenosidivorans]|uniref:4-hydroxy-3-methylbut-2-enyl diphosphate reductase n=1 Tax=Mucilaginibacter ginsenosidivorans TaxID=398053 RepID=A0A5B8UXL4_9SPHI|nr:hypothetical protein [Mucilaginibacter ginsenosidivorans]QEC63692.1 hypothetical protein FRZ54_14275 [Mucilaginibacter ginsenosidivorans]